MEKDNFVGYIDKNGIIWSKSFGQKNDIQIGMDMQAVNELKKDRDVCFEKAEKYLEEQYLISERKADPRPRPMSPEQKESQQTKINQDLLLALKELQSEIKVLKEEKIKGIAIK